MAGVRCARLPLSPPPSTAINASFPIQKSLTFGSPDEKTKLTSLPLRGSKIVYVGNLSFYTSEAQIIASFQRAGPVRRVIMGLNRHTRTPCGFCFVEYFTNEAALDCIAHVSGTTLDDRVIRCELDFGFREGRQFGRGASGVAIDGEVGAVRPVPAALQLK